MSASAIRMMGLALAMLLSAPAVALGAPSGRVEAGVPAAPVNLRTEGQAFPRGVDRAVPRLSWHSQVNSQTAYEIEAASSETLILAGVPDLWSSGIVRDGRSVAIAYGGNPLASRATAVWRVRVWADGAAQPGPWSAFASFQMGLLQPNDWQARWIASPAFAPVPSTPGLEAWLKATAADPQFKDPAIVEDTLARLRAVPPATYFRKDFTITRPVKSAMLYSTSAGYSEFFLSGEKIGDRIFNPAQTDFDKRIYYDVDDLTDQLTPGRHTLAAHLGNGFYAERTAFGMRQLFFGEPAVIAQLEIEYQDGSRETIISDASWQSAPSPVLKNGIYSGEVYDARARITNWAHPDSTNLRQWRPAMVMAQSPTQQMVAAEMPPVRRVKAVPPKALLNPASGVWTIDFGQNFTGVPTIDMARLKLKPGQTIVLRYGEWADATGQVSLNSGGGAPRTKQVDAYVSDGVDAQPWSPTFSWHGFRYMEVTGLASAPPLDAFAAHLTRTDLQRTGQFSSSSPLLNRIHETALWTLESNIVSVLSDCPIRERNGWTGDALAIGRMASYNFNFAPFLDRYLGDFRTAKVPAPAIVPGRRVRPGMVDWASAEIILAWEHYLHSADRSALVRQYDSMARYLGYVESIADGDRITNINHYYGDWCDTLPTPGMVRPDGQCRGVNTKGELTVNALIMRAYQLMARIASTLGKPDDAATYAARSDAFSKAFHTAYFDPKTGSYGSQTADAMALSFGIVPAPLAAGVAAALDADVRTVWKGHASVGALGQPWLYPALSDHGYADTAFGVFTAKGFPGYSYLFDTLGGTSLWEDMTNHVPARGAPGKSLSHPFKGGYDTWFYSGLGGISPDPDQPGYKLFILRPVFPADLGAATVSMETGYGVIRSGWSREGDTIDWRFEVPQNTSARVTVGPANSSTRTYGPGRYQIMLNAAGDRQLSVAQRD